MSPWAHAYALFYLWGEDMPARSQVVRLALWVAANGWGQA